MGERIDIFNPTPPQTQLLLDLLQRADCSLEDIAEALHTSVAALTVYLASDDAIEIFAQAELSNARRGRLAATAQLDKCAHALSLILDGYISDTTIAVRRDTPKNRREDLIHQESARRAATQLFKIANFTPRIVTSQLKPNPTRDRGVVAACTTTAETASPNPTSARLLAPPDPKAGRLATCAASERAPLPTSAPATINAQDSAAPDVAALVELKNDTQAGIGPDIPSPRGATEGIEEKRFVRQTSRPAPPAAFATEPATRPSSCTDAHVFRPQTVAASSNRTETRTVDWSAFGRTRRDECTATKRSTFWPALARPNGPNSTGLSRRR